MSFWIGAAKCSLRLKYAQSLKDRRHVVRSIVDGVRSRFNLSSSDLGPDGAWQQADLGFTAAGSSNVELKERLEKLAKFLSQRESSGEFEIADFVWEVFSYADISD
jgi:uncharacterized protein YlxP (DUF503 family)